MLKAKPIRNYILTLLACFSIGLAAVVSFSIGYKLAPDFIDPQTKAVKVDRQTAINMVGKLPKLYIVYSGSMEPSIMTGSMIATLPEEIYYPGDIVTFKNGDENITHRLVNKVYETTGDPYFVTKGDANEDIDNTRLLQKNITGKVILSLPYMGRVFDFAKTPRGFILFVVVPATIVIYEELKFLKIELAKKIKIILTKLRKKNTQNTAAVPKKEFYFPKAYALIPIIGGLVIVSAITAAYLLDIETSIGNVLGVSINYNNPAP